MTPHQQTAFDTLRPIFSGEQAGAHAVLIGAAGTGKTFTSARLLHLAREAFDAEGERNEWGGFSKLPELLILAPTHKAARQLERAMAGSGLEGLSATTVHSACALRPQYVEDRQVFVRDYKAKTLIGKGTRLVVIDELSMVSQELLDHVLGLLPASASLVGIGDAAQLMPVGDETLCSLFNAPQQAVLTEVVRHTGPVLELAHQARQRQIGRPLIRAAEDEHSRVVPHDSLAQWSEAAIEACREAAEAGSTDAARVLAWTNASVGNLNQRIHEAIYGEDAPPFVVGQPVVSHDAITDPDGFPLVSSTCEMQLVGVVRTSGIMEGDDLDEVRQGVLGKRDYAAGAPLPIWKWYELEAEIAGSGRTVGFPVLDPDCQTRYRQAQNVIAKAAKAAKAAGKDGEAKTWWRLYWKRQERFGRVDPVWALTVHKSQGSTFGRVFLHPDLDRNQDQGDLNRLFYVGVTRASRELHVVGDTEAAAEWDALFRGPLIG